MIYLTTEYISDQIWKLMLCFMTLHKLFTPEFTRGYWAPCSTSENVQNGLEHKHKNYILLLKSTSLCYVKIYFRYGILEVKKN